MSERQFCSELNIDEPMAGTAAQVDVWLLLEYRPVWKARPHADNALSAPVRRWIERSIEALQQAGYRPRLQFIRQPEIDSAETRLLLAGNGRLLQFSGDGYGFLDDVEVVSALAAGDRGRHLAEPRYFVCTNGQRDLCCARFGLRSYAVLRERLGARVWQITHLGGHRFAPNVLVLPESLLYGRVGEDSAGEFAAMVENGKVAFSNLRGRTCYPAHVQAAEAAAAQDGLRLLHVDGDAERATVTFGAGRERVALTVEKQPEAIAVSKSCGEAAEPVHPYRVVG